MQWALMLSPVIVKSFYGDKRWMDYTKDKISFEDFKNNPAIPLLWLFCFVGNLCSARLWIWGIWISSLLPKPSYSINIKWPIFHISLLLFLRRQNLSCKRLSKQACTHPLTALYSKRIGIREGDLKTHQQIFLFPRSPDMHTQRHCDNYYL